VGRSCGRKCSPAAWGLAPPTRPLVVALDGCHTGSALGSSNPLRLGADREPGRTPLSHVARAAGLGRTRVHRSSACRRWGVGSNGATPQSRTFAISSPAGAFSRLHPALSPGLAQFGPSTPWPSTADGPRPFPQAWPRLARAPGHFCRGWERRRPSPAWASRCRGGSWGRPLAQRRAGAVWIVLADRHRLTACPPRGSASRPRRHACCVSGHPGAGYPLPQSTAPSPGPPCPHPNPGPC